MAPKAECPGKERLENGQSECYDDFHNDESRESLLQDHDGQAGNHDLIALRKASWTPLILGIFLLSELMLLFFIFAAKARVLDECLKKHKSYCKNYSFPVSWFDHQVDLLGSTGSRFTEMARRPDTHQWVLPISICVSWRTKS